MDGGISGIFGWTAGGFPSSFLGGDATVTAFPLKKKKGGGASSEHSDQRFSDEVRTEKYWSHTWSNWLWDGSLSIWCISLMRAW
jgi:hypothetical protein